MAATTSETYGVIQVNISNSRQRSKKWKKGKINSTLLFRQFMVRTAIGSYNDTHTGTFTNTHAETPFVVVTKGKA